MAKAKREVNREVLTKGVFSSVWRFLAWLTGILVSLSVGFGIADGTLSIPMLSDIAGGIITESAGWIVVVLTILSVLLALIDKFSSN